jgi:glycosyltransferase involved in cell wall biosynthesis
MGTVPADEVPGLIGGARALLVPSFWYEGQPRGILEAYAAGVPVIASRYGGLPEVVEDDESGLLLPPNEPEAWAAAVNQLLADDESERLGAGAWRLWSTRYGPDQGLEGLETSYREALGDR